MARTRVLLVLITCPNQTVGQRLARQLVSDQLAACVNIIPRIESIFRWQGKIEHAQEALLLVKTKASSFEQLRRFVLKNHPYEVPEIIAFLLTKGHAPYLKWVRSSVRE